MRRMTFDGVRAICFDLDDTFWDIRPVLARAERILADWLRSRYPRLAENHSEDVMLAARDALSRELPARAHDLTFLRRETLARLAERAGYDRDIAHEAFATWHAARNECTPYEDVVPALSALGGRFRLATLSNGNADLGRIGLAHHFEVRLHATELGCAKPHPRAYRALADALTLDPAQILFVGDEPHADVIGPRAAGMRTAWVDRAGNGWRLDAPPPDASVPDLAALARLLVR